MRHAGLLALTLVPLAVLRPEAQDRPLPAFDAFVAEVKHRLQTDGDLQHGYSYVERRVEQKLDGSGAVKEERVKLFEVYPRLPGEDEPYRRLIEEDGEPVPAATLEKADRERREKAEKYARRIAEQSEDDRRKAQREYEKALAERAEDIEDIFNVYDVQMLRRDRLDGHETIVFDLIPRPDAEPRTDSGDMMSHFRAVAWISESEYELVRIDVEAVRDVSFGFGLLARLHKGTTLSFERRKVNGERWLPARVEYRGSGRLLLLRRVRVAGSSEFSNYRRFTVDTSTTIGEPPPDP